MHDNLKSLDPDPVAAIGERSRTLAISFDLAPCLNNNSLALPTHHHDTEALGFSLRNLSLQFGFALLAPLNNGDSLLRRRRLQLPQSRCAPARFRIPGR